LGCNKQLELEFLLAFCLKENCITMTVARKHQFMNLFAAIIRPTECFATGGRIGLKTRSPKTVVSEREKASLGGYESSRSHTLEKSRSQEERPAEAIFRETQMDRQPCRRHRLKERGDERFFQGGLPQYM